MSWRLTVCATGSGSERQVSLRQVAPGLPFGVMRTPRATAAIVATTLMACATSAGPQSIRFPETGTRPVAHIDGIFTYASALATIGSLFEQDFGFPPVSALLTFYPDEKAVEAALLASGHEPALARDGAARLRAIAAHGRVIVNESKMLDRAWADRVASLAHELVHCLQYELGGGVRGTSEQWLREGFAEWVALGVLERLRALETGEARQLVLERLRASDTARAPSFDDMRTFPQWVGLGGRKSIAPQAQATLAVDLLITQHGIPAVLAYFKRFATAQDPDGNFRAAFGMDRSTFEEAFDATLGLRRSRGSRPSVRLRVSCGQRDADACLLDSALGAERFKMSAGDKRSEPSIS